MHACMVIELVLSALCLRSIEIVTKRNLFQSKKCDAGITTIYQNFHRIDWPKSDDSLKITRKTNTKM